MSRGPGIWQRMFGRILAETEWFLVADTVAAILQRPMTDAEYKALIRAAHRLAKSGKAAVWQVWGEDYQGRRVPRLILTRPGVTPASLNLPAVPLECQKHLPLPTDN